MNTKYFWLMQDFSKSKRLLHHLSMYPHLQPLCDNFIAVGWHKVVHNKTGWNLGLAVGFCWKDFGGCLPGGLKEVRNELT